MLATYRACLQVQEDYDSASVGRFGHEISQFVLDQKTVLTHLIAFKKQLKAIVPIKEQEMKYYKDFAQFLEKYEDSKNAASNQTGALAHVKLISGGEHDALKMKLDTMTEKQTNPVRHINYWVKGEVLGLDSLIAAINYKDSIDDRKRKTQSQIQDLTDSINKLNSGKFTFGGMLKSDSQKKESAV